MSGKEVILREHFRTLIEEEPIGSPLQSKFDLMAIDAVVDGFFAGDICLSWDPKTHELNYRALMCEKKGSK